MERRKYLRIDAPIQVRIITKDNHVDTTYVKNVSPLGMRFKSDKKLEQGEMLELTLLLTETKNPVHIYGKVVWQNKNASEGDSAYDVGCEFIKIEEDNKNTFLKYFCDLIYGASVTVKKKE